MSFHLHLIVSLLRYCHTPCHPSYPIPFYFIPSHSLCISLLSLGVSTDVLPYVYKQIESSHSFLSLISLDLSSNSLSAFPSILHSLSALKKLILAGNALGSASSFDSGTYSTILYSPKRSGECTNLFHHHRLLNSTIKRHNTMKNLLKRIRVYRLLNLQANINHYCSSFCPVLLCYTIACLIVCVISRCKFRPHEWCICLPSLFGAS